jgi:glycerol kinase
MIETTVAGACYLAGLGVGLWQSQAEVKDIWRAEREFSVQMSASARRSRLASWNTAVQRTLL